MSNEMFCKDCLAARFLVDTENKEGAYEGRCHLNPPQYAGDFQDDDDPYWGFPEINSDDWCVQGRRMMAMNDTISVLLNKEQQE